MIILYDNYEGNEMFEVEYYESEAGERPAEAFMDSVGPKMKAKIFGCVALLKERGSLLSGPYSSHLKDGIFELRASLGNNAARVLYFFVSGQKAILTHGFVKKTQKTPRSQIERAKRLRADWKRRNG